MDERRAAGRNGRSAHEIGAKAVGLACAASESMVLTLGAPTLDRGGDQRPFERRRGAPRADAMGERRGQDAGRSRTLALSGSKRAEMRVPTPNRRATELGTSTARSTGSDVSTFSRVTE